MKKLIVFIAALTSQFCLAQEVMVGLEPLPPLIKQDATGYTVTLLKKIEEVSDLKFNIRIKPYVRIKDELKNDSLDLIGHTPYQHETPDFYQYAQDLDWNITAMTDLYATSEAKLDLANAQKIGTPRGNAEFYSETLGIPITRFTSSGDIDSLLKMLKDGRIDVFVFERASTMGAIKNLNLKNIFYKKIIDIPATLSLRKDPAGDALKAKIDDLIKKVNYTEIFKDYNRYVELPAQGVVDIDKIE
jgi:polar amino acid transport system substrate-binding protein